LAIAGYVDNETSLYLRDLDRLDVYKLEGTEGAVFPFFSPDGRWIGFSTADNLKRVSPETGEVLTICQTPGWYGADWGTDGYIYFVPPDIGRLHRVRESGGTPRPVDVAPPRGNAVDRWPCCLPGDLSILVTEWSGFSYETPNITLLSLETGERRTLTAPGTCPVYIPTGHIMFARPGALAAVPFDITQLGTTGPPFNLIEDKRYPLEPMFSISGNGTLVLADVAGDNSQSAQRQLGTDWQKERTLLWLNRDGNTEPLPAKPGPYTMPNLSPDGKRLALTLFREKAVENWVLEIDRGVFTRVTFERNDHMPVWSPDGKHFAISATEKGAPNIFVVPVDGRGEPERQTRDKDHQDPASWTPDGQTIAFVDFPSPSNGDIWLVDRGDTASVRPLIVTQYDERHAMISSDGNWMAYTSNRSEQYEIYVESFPDRGKSFQVSLNGGTDPMWARSGDELFFWTVDRGVENAPLNVLMSAEINTEPAFSVGTPRELLRANWASHSSGRPNYDVSPDGQRFIIIEPDKELAPIRRVRVVTNWFERLRDL
jgi:Tol biopolymer transport system component